MEIEIQVNIQGLEDLEAKLKELAPQQAKRAIRTAARRATALWVDEVEKTAPVQTGFLSTHIEQATSASSQEQALVAAVGPDKKAFYGMFAEFGTRKQKPEPFMRPVFEQTRQQVLDAFAEEINSALERLKK